MTFLFFLTLGFLELKAIKILNLVGKLFEPLGQDCNLLDSPGIILLTVHRVLPCKAGISKILTKVFDCTIDTLLGCTLLNNEIIVSPLVVDKHLLISVYQDLCLIVELFPVV